ncbi:MAG: KpsF/GutQ family sugar-phosphate isomerase [Bacteroidales bacterium]|nr:KpsF/GutQ family sugar-phosphate isomerase [Bacteroidales bacterium]
MKTKEEIINIAKATIKNEVKSIINLEKSINDDFTKSIELILNSEGRVIITGIGKSANIGTKIVATLNSTGTPSIFMHAADAIHGDLGMVQKEDVVICISKSGNTPEIKVLVPLLKQRGNFLIAIVGNINSYLAKQADYILDTTVEKEACHNNLAPTSSTTAQLVMGDALAVCLLECRGFSINDFAKYHPGGALGKKLYLRVSDLYINNEKPEVDINDNIKSIIMEISSKRLGATAVLDNDNLVGIITDGDLRRMLQKSDDIRNITSKNIMTKNPKTIDADTLVVDAFYIMKKNNITQMLVTNNNRYVGVIHLHDILKEGIL